MGNVTLDLSIKCFSCLFSQRKRHYWILDWKSITLYQNESSTKYYKVEFKTDKRFKCRFS